MAEIKTRGPLQIYVNDITEINRAFAQLIEWVDELFGLRGGLTIYDAVSLTTLTISTLSSGQVVITTTGGELTTEATLAITRGGTGQATKAAGFDALSPTTTRGDLIVRNATTNTRLATGASGTVMIGGTDPAYSATPSMTGITCKWVKVVDDDGNTIHTFGTPA